MNGIIKTISESSEKKVGFFESQRKVALLMILSSEKWGETEKPGTMMDTQAFIRDDHPGYLLLILGSKAETKIHARYPFLGGGTYQPLVLSVSFLQVRY